jgi:uncharacterized protein (TIGR02599 family)
MKLAVKARRDNGFTLVELLISMALVTIILVVLASITSSTQRSWTYTTANVEQFRDSREAFEAMTRKLSQATLNTYWDYNYTNGKTQPPTSYMRQSDLRFVCGNAAALTATNNVVTQATFFQAPLGYASNSNYVDLDHLLNTWGFFIKFGNDSLLRPPFLASTLIPLRYRFRLMELMEPSDSLSIYKYTSGIGKYTANVPNNTLYVSGPSNTPPSGFTGYEWFTDPFNNVNSLPVQPVRPLAENIVALIFLPMLSKYDQTAGGYSPSSLAPNYAYDSTGPGAAASYAITSQAAADLNSTNQLPPVVQVTMVAVDETSYKRFQGTSATAPSSLLVTSSSVFQTAGDTVNPANPGLAQDLKSVETNLQAYHLNYRVFSTNVSIEGSKWSRAQQN